MSDQNLPCRGITVLNLLSVTLSDIWGMLLLASADNISAEVELLAVVWEVRESVLYVILLPHYYPHPLK